MAVTNGVSSERVSGGYAPDAGPVAGECAAPRPGAEVLTLDSLDKRTRPYRRYLHIRDAITGDMGGAEALSEVQRQMVSKFATLALSLEVMEAEAARGEEIDLDQFGRLAGHMRRLGETLGIQRKARDVTLGGLLR